MTDNFAVDGKDFQLWSWRTNTKLISTNYLDVFLRQLIRIKNNANEADEFWDDFIFRFQGKQINLESFCIALYITDFDTKFEIVPIDLTFLVLPPWGFRMSSWKPKQLENTSVKEAYEQIKRYLTPKTKVIFRMFEGVVIALMPEIPYAQDKPSLCESFSVKDGHAAANYDLIIENSKPAKPEEYKHCYDIMTRYGYNIDIRKQCTQQMRRKRLDNLK
jgi:hypothetical protein